MLGGSVGICTSVRGLPSVSLQAVAAASKRSVSTAPMFRDTFMCHRMMYEPGVTPVVDMHTNDWMLYHIGEPQASIAVQKPMPDTVCVRVCLCVCLRTSEPG